MYHSLSSLCFFFGGLAEVRRSTVPPLRTLPDQRSPNCTVSKLRTNEFKLSWLFTGKGVLDMASSLPVLCIPARLIGASRE